MKTSISTNCSASLNTNIVFYREWYEAIAVLPEELQNVAYKALFDRAFIGKEPDNVLLNALISIMMSTIDRTRTKYERKAEGRTRGRKPKEAPAPEVPSDEPEAPEDEALDEFFDDEPEAAEEALTEITTDQQRDMELRAQFDAFRREYPGAKRGLDVEFQNLKARTAGRWREVIPLLSKGLARERAWHDELRRAGRPVPGQACLQTWINNNRWETEYPTIEQEPVATPQPEQPHVETRRERERRERDEHARLVEEYRQQYRRRVPGAFTDRAPINYAQYMINHCYDMSDQELDRFMHGE